MPADLDLSPEAVERLAKMADTAEKAAVNAERMCELLRPEFDAFEARTGHNTYVVRDYVDHRNAAQRQRKEAFAIRALTAENARLRAEVERLRESLNQVRGMAGWGRGDAKGSIRALPLPGQPKEGA